MNLQAIMQMLPQQIQQRFNTFVQGYNKQYGDTSPQQVVQNLLNSGKMSQTQFNQYRDMTNKITGMNF